MNKKSEFVAVSLSDVKGSFNADLFETVLLHIEEINDQRGKVAEILKPYVTQDEQRSNAKYKAQAQVRKHFGLVLSSNHLNPILIEATDRRYFVPVFSKHQSHQGETKAFYQRFADWLISEGGLQAMCDWLHQIDIAKYDFRSAPMTKDKQDTTVYETRSEGHMTRAVFELTELADTTVSIHCGRGGRVFQTVGWGCANSLETGGYIPRQKSTRERRKILGAAKALATEGDCIFALDNQFRSLPNHQGYA